MRTEDGHIVQECLNGEPGAFGMLVDKYREGIYAFAYDKLRDFQDAQDVTQEVFLKAYEGLRTLRRWESLAFWLYRIAYARCADLLRIKSRRVDRDFIEDQDPEVMDAPSLDSYRRDQMGQSVREALDSMPDAYREVLVLHYFGGMKIKDMARALGASPDAIGKRLSRARALLKEEMIDMVGRAFEGQRLPMGFTFRIVEAVKRIKIQPMPRATALPWGLSLATGIIMTILSLNSYISIPSDMAIPRGSPLPLETKVLKTGEIPVDIMKVDKVSVISSKQDDGKGPQNSLILAPYAEGGKWTAKTGMTTARYALSTCAVDGTIYAFGGAGGPAMFNPLYKFVEAYDPVADTWVKKADMPTARAGLSTSVVDGIIYAIGGMIDENVSLSTVEAYDPAADTWMSKADMPTSRMFPSTSVVDGIIYAIGGQERKGGVKFATVEAYNPVTDTWVRKADMPTPRAGLSISVVDGIIYAISGFNEEIANRPDGVQIPTVEAYDPKTDKWTPKEDIPTARYWLSTGVVDGIIYAIGGYTGNPGFVIPTVEAYNPAKDKWTKKADMPTARCGLGGSIVNGKIYAIGGWLQVPNSPTNAVEEFDPGTPPGGKVVEPTDKRPTTWGEVKTD